MKRVKKIIYYVMVTILILLIAALLIGKWRGMHLFTVLTGSMEPVLPVGSVIITMPVELEELEVGDDITYLLDENLTVVTHRIIEIDTAERRVTTQGVANAMADKPVMIENVVGRVIFCVPELGKLLVVFADTKAKIIAVVVLAAIIIIGSLFSKVEEEK